ncbi:hypothetical protein [Beijerinckia indica]|uniref:N-acetyltransferase domain-containing protein n=1 Tax=Beijerinckia indica subsp. indica (strain ATCC 9039 / DSM 1715 / NCIMB 8712) TaxID=395963 RepID=B2IJ28_BEII9|nr:hypothetical protein [Beijerinckia indica]ACB94791.1 conserved hypothetical protein [Beijerinckia indica subsp. indica ATCC 9039]
MIEIVPVAGLSRFLTFCRLPRLLYKNMPGYAAPLDVERWTLYGKRFNPHFKLVESQSWLARRDGQWVGRIYAHVYHENFTPRQASRGQFGCLDAIQDQAVVDALLTTAENWLRQRGMTKVHGPFSPSINGECGLLIKGFELTPTFMVPWHPSYLQTLVEARNYTKAKDLVSYCYETQSLADIDKSVSDHPDWRDRLRIRALDAKNIKSEIAIFVDIFNDAWAENWGFVPLTLEELMAHATALKHIIPPEGGYVIELDGKPQAFGMILFNLYELVENFDGKLLPFNFLKLIDRVRHHTFKTSRTTLFGMRRALHRKATGGAVMLAFLEEIRKRGKATKLEQVECGWVLEDNRPMRRMIEMIGGEVGKIHRIYEKDL